MKLHYRCRDCKYYWNECYVMRGRRRNSYVCKNFCNKDINKTLENIKEEILYLTVEPKVDISEVIRVIDNHIGKEGAEWK